MKALKLYLKEKLLCKNEKYLFCYYKGSLILRSNKNKKFIQKLKIYSKIKAIELVERLFRYEPRVAISLNTNEFLFSLHGHIYNYSVLSNSITIEHHFAKGMNNPLNFCVVYDNNGNILDILYGEYIWNTDKGEVAIYRRKNSTWIEIFTFPPNTVTHIHNIVFDKYNHRYLIMTGDTDEESAIWTADMDFTTVEPIVKGKQKYRACILYPTKDAIYYATDTPLEQNWFYKIDENNEKGVIVKKIHPLPGPCIFGKALDGKFYMATSVEGDPTQNIWKYRMSNKLGNGVKDRYVHLLEYSLNQQVKEILKIRKDIWPMWLFQFGNIQFPNVVNDKNIYICPQSTVYKSGTYILEEVK